MLEQNKIRSLKYLATSASLISFMLLSQISNAETVNQAINYALNNNPQMQLELETLRLADEGIMSAKANLAPILNGSLSITDSISKSFSEIGGWSPTQNALGLTASLSANYTLWDNGIVKNQIAQANINKLAQLDNYASSKQRFIATIFASYIDVIRDAALLNVQMKNFNILSQQQKTAEARFEVGEATQTEIALARARKSASKSAIANAKAQLDISRAMYEQYVGHRPKNLKQPNHLSHLLPSNLERSIASIEINHPTIMALKMAILSAEKSVNISQANQLPMLAAFGTLSQSIAFDGSNAQTNAQIGARLSIPIYDGGLKASQTNQSKIKVAQARLNLTMARAQIKANVTARWAGLKAAKTSYAAQAAQIIASRAVLNGVRAEAEQGIRTTFDILNAEQELLSAKVQNIVSEHSVLMSEVRLLLELGILSSKN